MWAKGLGASAKTSFVLWGFGVPRGGVSKRLSWGACTCKAPAFRLNKTMCGMGFGGRPVHCTGHRGALYTFPMPLFQSSFMSFRFLWVGRGRPHKRNGFIVHGRSLCPLLMILIFLPPTKYERGLMPARSKLTQELTHRRYLILVFFISISYAYAWCIGACAVPVSERPLRQALGFFPPDAREGNN
jgi:hypothetical protein